MAGKKYLSKIGKGGDTIYIKDLEAQDALLIPVSVDSLTPSSTFVKNAVIGINGVLYRATAATSNLPCTLTIQDGAFVTHTVNGKTSFVVSDPTPNAGWEIWTDAATEYWLSLLDTRITSLENLSVTYNGITYTLAQLMASMAQLMQKTVVVG